MYSWFSAQQSLVQQVSDKSGVAKDEEPPILPSTVFRPICSKDVQLVLIKEVIGSIVSFSIVVVFAVFRGAVARDQSVARRIRVSKSVGINAPAEAVSRVLALYLDWVPPAKVA